ncbi:MAG: hypothetical protein PUF12_07250 [Thermoflexaceae bacterium]|nr:hypothetical protein [Thermoflexaceae bacterium]
MIKAQKRNLLRKTANYIRKVAERTEENYFTSDGFYKPKKPAALMQEKHEGGK